MDSIFTSTWFQVGVIQIVASQFENSYLGYKVNQNEQGRIFGLSGLALRCAQ